MSGPIIGILVTHAAILGIQFILSRMFPSQKRAVRGIYFILLPIGFQFFMPPPPALTAVMGVGGVCYVFFEAQKAAAGAARSVDGV